MSFSSFRCHMSSIYNSRIGTSFGFLSLAQAMTAVTNFGIIAFFTKRLPPAEYGMISIVWLFVVVLSMFVDCRLNTAFSIKYYKSDHTERASSIATILSYNLLLWGVFSIFFCLLPGLVRFLLKVDIASVDLRMMLVLVLFMVIGNFYTSYLIVSRQSKRYLYMMMVFNSLLLTGALGFLFAGHGYRSYLEAYVLAYTALSCVGMYDLYTAFPVRTGKGMSKSVLPSLLKLSLPLIPDGLLLMMIIWAGRYIINLHGGLAMVGVYSVAYSFSNIFNNFIVTPFGQAIFPVVAERFVRSEQEYNLLMQQIFKYYWLVILAMILAYFVVLQDFYRLFIGVKYHASYNVVIIMLMGTIFSGAAGLISATVIMKEKTGKIFQFTVASAATNMVLNILLIPLMGMYGAAIAVMGGYMVQFFIILYYTQRLRRISYDYGFVLRSSILTLIFIGIILAISYAGLPPLQQTALKLSVALTYVCIVIKRYHLKEKLRTVAQDMQPRSDSAVALDGVGP